ncbi:hypothetical protein ABZ807_29085 [Micromonospora sp. NPDC047548]|uniref:hypothetical protein n=1 Tax=Micromonospora sp. NPDC047548 TaxID=3155624 RepID=UPI0033E26007
MTRQKSFKSRVRTRMGRTGESYPAARRHLLASTVAAEPPTSALAESTPPATGSGAAQTDRISEALVRERTGRGWDEWFTLLDEWGEALGPGQDLGYLYMRGFRDLDGHQWSFLHLPG